MLVLQEVALGGVHADLTVRIDVIALGDHGSGLVVLGEDAELVSKVGGVDLLGPQHLHEIRLGHVGDPLHILARIEPGAL